MHYPRKYSHTLEGGRFKKDMFAHFPKIVFFSIVIVINCNQIDTLSAIVCQNGKVLGILSFQSLIFSFKFVKIGLHRWLPHNLKEAVFFCIICIIQCKVFSVFNCQFKIFTFKFAKIGLRRWPPHREVPFGRSVGHTDANVIRGRRNQEIKIIGWVTIKKKYKII